MAVELLAKELADARGDFDAALEQAARGLRCARPRRCRRSSDADRRSRADDPGARARKRSRRGGARCVFSPALELMRGVVRRASARDLRAAWAKPELRGMGTTLTAMLVHGGKAHLVHAGDSRCYMFRDGQLRQITDDHSWIAEQLKAGSITRGRGEGVSKFRHVITKSIGFERDIEADLQVACRCRPATASCCAPTGCRTTSSTASSSGSSR